MVSMVAYHARDRGSNPGGLPSFFTSWRPGNLVRGVVTGYTSLYGVCKVARLGSKRSKGGKCCDKAISGDPNSLAVGVTL